MTSAQSNTILAGKNNSSVHSPAQQQQQQQQQQTTSPGFEAGTRRPNSAVVVPSGRNNQNARKQHKNQRRPKLADEDSMAESGAFRGGRRGQTSITHLMNFTLPPRPHYNPALNRGTRRNPTYGLGSGHHASDKARYIHANYRFIVSPAGDYHIQAIDADVHLDWSNVLQILASAESQTSSCPICLSHPVAPRMAKCGHIFCLPCLIRYMHSTDDTNPTPDKKARWKKCPICWDTIYISDTRPVRWFTGQEGSAPREGEDVVLRLVMRNPGGTLALPRDGADALAKSEDIPWYFAAEVTDYARVMKGSEDYMTAQFDAEIKDLLRQEKEDELMFGEDTEWTRKAVRAVNEAKERIKGLGNPPLLPKEPPEKKPKRLPIQFNESNENTPEMYFIQHAARSGQSFSGSLHTSISKDADTESFGSPEGNESALPSAEVQFPTALDDSPLLAPRALGWDGHSHHPNAPYYFYQALLHYYLAPLDIRILKAEFGNFASFPSTLLPRVERVSTGHIVDNDLRKRTKYLAHLPYGCEVGFLECDWTDIVRPEVLDQFKVETERRRKRNKEKEIREEKDRIRAEKEEDDKRWAAARRKRPEIPEESFAEGDFQPLPSSSLDATSSSPPWPSRQGSAFASLASPSTSPVAPRTVWGTARITPLTPELQAQSEPEEDDGWLQDWEKELLAENALISKARELSMSGEGSPAGSGGSNTPVGGKKKKGKKITLMSTTARRAA